MDEALMKAGNQMAREIQAVIRKQANEVYPGSRLAKSIRVLPESRGENIGFKVDMVSYGDYQDFGTYGRGPKGKDRATFRRSFDRNPPRRRGRKKWSPSGIAPSFFTSLDTKTKLRIFDIYKKEMRKYVRRNLPRKINFKVS